MAVTVFLTLLLAPAAHADSFRCGAGYEHRFDTGAINLELRYNRTFSDIADGDNTRINGVNIFAGWGFNLQLKSRPDTETGAADQRREARRACSRERPSAAAA